MSQRVTVGDRVIVGVSMSAAQRETIKAYATEEEMSFSAAFRKLALESLKHRRQIREPIAA